MKQNAKIYTVGQINSLVKAALEEGLPSRLIVRGEISDWKRHSSGHCYFSLKDSSGVLPSVMWSGRFRTVKFKPEDGMAVLATGHVDVYTAGGKYQLYVDKLEPEGVGALQLAFEQMVRRLAAQGLFEDEHKKPLPAYPMRIAMLTSESGAALHDITESIHHRWPCARLFLHPVPVQGEGAAEKIAAALRDVNRRNKSLRIDVLIVGRGGGSLEDLWAFNEEVLARAIFDSEIPVISAVGHEVDTTIADLVADARASTPTKAGVVAVPDIREVLGQLDSIERRLAGETKAVLTLARRSLDVILAGPVFRTPLRPVQNARQQVDELHGTLAEVMGGIVAESKRLLAAAYEQVVRIEPHRLLGKKVVHLNNMANRTNGALLAVVNGCRMNLAAAENRLAALNPRSVLQRGYTITTSGRTGKVVRGAEDVEIGETLVTELANENLIESKVTNRVRR